MRHFAVAALVGLFALAIAPFARADATVDEKVVGPASEQGTIYTLSPKGLHLATVSMKGSRWVVTVDGTEGPKFDEIFRAAFEIEPERWEIGMLIPPRLKWEGPVAFSPDGTRYAYAAREGDKAVVIVDGKEIWRGPSSQQSKLGRLGFTPDSKHVYFYYQAEQRGVLVQGAFNQPDVANYSAGHIVLDGQPGPLLAGVPLLFFSPDGSRWGYVGQKETGYNQFQPFLVIDGKDADYAGDRARFTPDGKSVVCLRADPQNNQPELLVDGKPIMRAARIHTFTISAQGDIAAIADDAQNPAMLYLNGKPVAGTENAIGGPAAVGPPISFSPDGKHWALLCANGPRAWAIVDGKKQQEYNAVRLVQFSPDSSKCLYIAEMSNKKFVVVNGEEEDGNTTITIMPFFSQTGNHYAYAAGPAPGSIKAYYDGKPLPQSYLVQQLTLSPDGTRHAYYAVANALSSSLVVDGQVKGAAGGQGGGTILFSPDSKHIVAFANSPTERNATIYLDGDYIAPPQGMGYPQFLGFTPDSQHLVMTANEDVQGRATRCYYLNFSRVASFSMQGVNWGTGQMPRLWEAGEDGKLAFAGPEPAEMAPGPMHVARVTPDPASNVSTIAADMKSAAEKKAADEKAAKEKAEADKKAAYEKAQAEQKAAYEKAVAEKKAAYEKAMADRKAAQEKAIADKKAAADKAAADKAAKQKQP